MCPTPGPAIQKKFDYFYQAYNYATNTSKYMTFEEPTGYPSLERPHFEQVSYSNQHQQLASNIDMINSQ